LHDAAAQLAAYVGFNVSKLKHRRRTGIVHPVEPFLAEDQPKLAAGDTADAPDAGAIDVAGLSR
jgi:hypothetical protein